MGAGADARGNQPMDHHGVKLRVGIAFWLLSWVPYGLIFGLSGAGLAAAWTVEILLGIIGLALAGTEFAQAVKEQGWKNAPKVAWHTLLHGNGAGAAH